MPGMTDRDHFAAAALTGLLAQGDDPVLSQQCEYAYRIADAMLRERAKTNHDAAPAARGDARECTAPVTTGGTQWLNYNANDYVRVKLTAHGRELLKKTLPSCTPPTEDADGWSRWQLHRLMNVFGEYMVMGLPLCFETAIRLEAVPPNLDAAPAAIVPEPEPEAARRRPAGGTGDTVHGASPEARAESDEDRADKAATSHRRDGTGDTPEPIIGCVSDRPTPITGPDPDSRVWETHTPAAHATPGECSVPREGTQEPVAWGVANGSRVLATSISRMDAVDMQSEYEVETAIVPLYRHPPALTDAEREALERTSIAYELLPTEGAQQVSATLRGLLGRLGGGE